MLYELNDNLINKALNLSRLNKILFVLILDITLCFIGTWLALYVELEKVVIINSQFLILFLISISVLIPIFFALGFYRVILRYINEDTLQVLTKASIIYIVFFVTFFWIFKIQNTPKSFGFIQPMLMFLLIGSSRFLIKIWLKKYILFFSNKNNKKRSDYIWRRKFRKTISFSFKT